MKYGTHTFNIADSNPYDLNKIFYSIGKSQVGADPYRIQLPTSLVRAYIKLFKMINIKPKISRQGLDYLVYDSVLDIDKAKKEINFRPKFSFDSLFNQTAIK